MVTKTKFHVLCRSSRYDCQLPRSRDKGHELLSKRHCGVRANTIVVFSASSTSLPGEAFSLVNVQLQRLEWSVVKATLIIAGRIEAYAACEYIDDSAGHSC